ncbi:MAG: phosphopantothenoylcysteine decarboxylase [Puniceicoccaceae bacterium]|nr:MAG: phosphopantothenoylcysteine decarboxylase [Puniceicoccaceae bacterium]
MPPPTSPAAEIGPGPLAGRIVVLGITGSIAAYKAADLAGRLRKAGAEVHPVLTAAGEKFITPLTLQSICRQPVGGDLWEEGKGWQPGHIELADKADLLLIAPATADILARFSWGLANDFLTSLYLACRAPVLIAPAMNGKMYSHPATEENIRRLEARGHRFIGPEAGMLACGYEGLGRLWPVEEIAAEAIRMLTPVA